MNYSPYPQGYRVGQNPTFDTYTLLMLAGGVAALVSLVITMVYLPAVAFGTAMSWAYSPWVLMGVFAGAAVFYIAVTLYAWMQTSYEALNHMRVAKLTLIGGVAMMHSLIFVFLCTLWGVYGTFFNKGKDYITGNVDEGILPDQDLVFTYIGLVWSTIFVTLFVFVSQLAVYPAINLLIRIHEAISIKVKVNPQTV